MQFGKQTHNQSDLRGLLTNPGFQLHSCPFLYLAVTKCNLHVSALSRMCVKCDLPQCDRVTESGSNEFCTVVVFLKGSDTGVNSPHRLFYYHFILQ